MTERITISMPDDLAKRINDQLEYGDNRSELVRELLRDGLDAREGDKPEMARQGVDSEVKLESSDKREELPVELVDALGEYRERVEQDDPDRADDRVAAARAIMEMLVDGGVSRSEAQQELLPEYAVKNQSETTWWQRQAKDLFSDLDCVRWNKGSQQYEFVE